MTPHDRPRTERLRVADALVTARDQLAKAQALLAAEPSPAHEQAVVRARRDVEILERRSVQVND